MRKRMLATVLLGLAVLTTPATARAEEGQGVAPDEVAATEVVSTEAAGMSEATVPAEPAAVSEAAGPAVPSEPVEQSDPLPVPNANVEVPESYESSSMTNTDTVPGPESTVQEPPSAAPETSSPEGARLGATGQSEMEEAPEGAAPTEDDALPTGVAQAADATVPSDQAPANSAADHAAPVSTAEAAALGTPATDETPTQVPLLTNDAVYAISAASAPTLAIAAKANGNVELAKKGTLLGEYWRAIDCGDGGYLLVNLDGSRALSVSGAIRNGTNVVVAETGSRWALIKNADGTYTVVPMGSEGFCLDVYGVGKTVGSNLQLYARNGNETQRFSFRLEQALTEAVASATTLEGVYTIAPTGDDKLSFDVASGSKDAGANVRLWTANGTLAQMYDLTSLGNGLYLIRPGHSGKVLEVQGGSTAAGANVRQYTRNDTLAQIWYLVADGAGYRIRNAKSGRALDLAGGSVAKASNLQLGDSTPQASQVFALSRTSLLANAGVYRLTPQNATKLFAAVAGNSSSTTAAVKTASDASVLGQYWRVDVQEDGSIVLANLRSNAALAAKSLVKAEALAVSDTTQLALRVSLNDDGTISFHPRDNASLVVDVKGGSASAGAALQLWTSNGSKAQRFVATLNGTLTAAAKAGSPVQTGAYQIKVSSSPSWVLDIAGGSKVAGGNVQLYADNGTIAQTFFFTSVGNGLYTIQSANSGKLLNVAGESTASGANVQQDARTERLSQYWYVVSDGAGGFSIRNAKSGHALDVAKGKLEKKSNIQIHTYNGTAAERFVLASASIIKDGTYSFSSGLTYGSLVFEVAGGSLAAGGNVTGHQANGTDAQKWVVRNVGSGRITLKNLKSGLFLDVAGASLASGANVVQAEQSDADSQLWIVGITDDGGLTFMNANSGRFLDVANGKTNNGVNIRQWNGNGSASQTWHIKTDNVALPSGKVGTLIARMVYYCDIANVGYDQSNRWDVRDGGECDCSSLVITCLQEAGFKTGSATYTGNMSSNLVADGWKRIAFDIDAVKPGDILLNDAYHVCVVVSGTGKSAMVAQASIGDGNRVSGGQAGDQTGYETNIKQVYIYSNGGWDCILRYTK